MENNMFRKILHPNPEGVRGSLEKQKAREFPEYVHNYFSSGITTKEFKTAQKIFDYYIMGGKLPEDIELFGDEQGISNLKSFISTIRMIPGTDIDGVIKELVDNEVLMERPKEKKVKEEIIPEHIQTEFIELEGSKAVEMSEGELEVVEANLLLEEIKRKNIFANSSELDALHNKVILEDSGSSETIEYYKEFSEKVKGGQEEIESDFADLEKVKEIFLIKKSENTNNKIEQAKKIATLTEYALAEGVSKFKWYGDKVSVSRTSEFDDIKRGVDDVLEIKKEGDESDFLGLGIDVTFRGLESEQFKEKFFKLLQSIFDGHQTKIKYFKDAQGECKKEFTVPKMVLYFSVDDVRDMVDILRHGNTELGENELHNSPQKENIMNQIVHSCKKLAKFAEEYKNPVFRKYYTVINSLKELSFSDPRISELIEVEHTDIISLRFDELIQEFKDIQKARKETGL